ncbi:MAG: MoxR family ATPase [Planctomycetota bacterium]
MLATQNPIEQEGTYPLPEAQLDRFMFMIKVDYPSYEDELEIVRRTTTADHPTVSSVLSGPEILQLQELVRKVPVADSILEYAMKLVRATRLRQPETPDFITEWISWGAGPRAAQYLILGAKARALLKGRNHVNFEDVQRVAYPVLRHRIITNFSAEAEGITPDRVIDRLLETIPQHGSEVTGDSKLPPVISSE